MFARAVLLIPGALFIVYGAMCWYNPELPAEYAGLWVAHQDGLAELAAMYGGLQLCLTLRVGTSGQACSRSRFFCGTSPDSTSAT